MEIPITDITELLLPYNPQCTISSKEYSFINDVVLAEVCLTTINPSVLYIIEMENLSEVLKLNCPGNILCINTDVLSKNECSDQLNLILLNTEENKIKIYQAIQKMIAEKREVCHKKNILIEALLSYRGLQAIIDTGYLVLGNPMFVSDLAFNIIAFNNNAYVDDPSWPKISANEYEIYERLKKLNETSVFENLYKSNVPVIETFDYTSFRWVANKISINGKSIGHIAVVESEKSFEDRDMEILQFICSLAAKELQKNVQQNVLYENPYEYFFSDLIDEKVSRVEVVQERIHSLNLQFKKNIFVLTLSKIDKTASSISIEFIKNYTNHLLKNEKSLIYKNQIVIILSTDKKEPFSESTYSKFCDFLNSNQMNGGLSQSFQDIAQLRQYYLQSITAMELGCRLEDEHTIYNYNDYSIYHLMDIAESQYDLKNFCNPLLFDLIDYDKKYNTNYCHNLYVYLLNDSSITKTSEVFQIHRNSMKYRIDKIEEILNVSLHNIEIKVSLFLTFKILSYKGEEYLFSEGNSKLY